MSTQFSMLRKGGIITGGQALNGVKKGEAYERDAPVLECEKRG